MFSDAEPELEGQTVPSAGHVERIKEELHGIDTHTKGLVKDLQYRRDILRSELEEVDQALYNINDYFGRNQNEAKLR